MNSLPRRTARAFSLLTIFLASMPVVGQTDLATARELFQEGRRLASAKDYVSACPKFEESYRLDPGVGTLLNLADCWEQLGRTASAWARFLEVADVTKRLGQSDRERIARARAAALEPKLSRLRIEVGPSDAGIEVLRDGNLLGKAQLGVDLPVDPGKHLVEARAPGKIAWSTNVEVPEAGRKAVVLVPPLAKDQAASSVPPNVAATTSSSTPSTPSTKPRIAATQSQRDDHGRFLGLSAPTWLLGGLGVAGLAVGTGFALTFHARNQDADAACPSGRGCTEDDVVRYNRAIDEAKTARWLSATAFSIGGAALIGGAMLWFTTDRQHSGNAVTASLNLEPRSLAPSATISGRW